MESSEPSRTKQTLEKQNTGIDSNNMTKDNCDSTRKSSRNDSHINIFLLICILGVMLAITLEMMNLHNRNLKLKDKGRRLYTVYSSTTDVENENGVLKHVHLVLNRIGYEKSTNTSPWNLLWSHGYPFNSLSAQMSSLKPYQKVNHFPGTDCITRKVDLATSDSKFIPKAFKLPKDKNKFLEYAADNKNALFLEKNNQHRGVYLKNVSEIDSSSGKSFVQLYVPNPFLVDGHKFDIGVYVVLTSVNPLRAYWYKGDILFRFCPAKYYPFDPRNLNRYVIADDYLPTWQVPSLAHPYTALGFSMKDAFDTYARSKGKNTTRMWQEVVEAITEVFIKQENKIIKSLKKYSSADNFFEMMRFDLVVDEELRVFLLEANMSPNLSSAHFPQNQLLYEQVLYNLFTLTGVAAHVQEENPSVAGQKMVSSDKNIAVWSDECTTTCKDTCDSSLVCNLCKTCIDANLKKNFLDTHREFLNKGDFRRLFPPAMRQNEMNEDYIKDLNMNNKLQYLWYQGKCNLDVTWCT